MTPNLAACKAMARVRFSNMPEARLDEWLAQPGMQEQLTAEAMAYLKASVATMPLSLNETINHRLQNMHEKMRDRKMV